MDVNEVARKALRSSSQPPRGANIAQKLTDLEARVRQLEFNARIAGEEAPNDAESDKDQTELPF